MTSIFDTENNISNLANEDITNKINKYIDENKIVPCTEHVRRAITFVYNQYIANNILLFLIIVAIVIFLIYRYNTRKYSNEPDAFEDKSWARQRLVRNLPNAFIKKTKNM